MFESSVMYRGISWVVITTAVSHVFCCVLPGIFSVLSLMASFGMISVLPSFMESWHGFIHVWETPIIIGSAVLLTFGWIAYGISSRIDCHNTGCEHSSCTPKKKHSAKIIWGATILFAINLSIYLMLHL